jgi:hypothetical protein
MTFRDYNTATECPLCGTSKQGSGLLVPVKQTATKGELVEAKQFHAECAQLVAVCFLLAAEDDEQGG